VKVGLRRFAPGLWTTAAALLVLMALVALGTWQVEI
jgi:cytochrome oxidase assembly protein ShyY1